MKLLNPNTEWLFNFI